MAEPGFFVCLKQIALWARFLFFSVGILIKSDVALGLCCIAADMKLVTYLGQGRESDASHLVAGVVGPLLNICESAPLGCTSHLGGGHWVT